MKLYRIILLAAAMLAVTSCGDDTKPEKPDEKVETIELSLADHNATAATKALYSNLWAIQSKGFMFGHHDDLTYGRYWYGEQGRSDTKDVCGDYPAVYSVDLAEMVDDRAGSSSSQSDNALKKRCIKDAYDRGMVVIACMHLDNPLTGGDSWDNSRETVVEEILKEGSPTRKTFLGWLDNLAAEVKNFKGSDGALIPIILRPWHEHTQTWSWWGSKCCTEAQFIALWRLTVTYLRDTKGVHNLIYAIAPQMDSQKTVNDFYFRWPGDEWVDFVGMDSYQGINNSVFTANLIALSKVSVDKKKPAGVTETGVESFTKETYWTENIHAPMTGRRVCMVVTWRNKFVGMNESDKHYFSVYKGHPSEADFVKMYKEENSFFCRDLPNMYKMAEGVTVK